jgi:hypothetical protein
VKAGRAAAVAWRDAAAKLMADTDAQPKSGSLPSSALRDLA